MGYRHPDVRPDQLSRWSDEELITRVIAMRMEMRKADRRRRRRLVPQLVQARSELSTRRTRQMEATE